MNPKLPFGKIYVYLTGFLSFFLLIFVSYPHKVLGNGTVDNPFVVTTCAELQDIDNNLSAHYALGNDIDCSMTSGWNGGKGFVPLGDNEWQAPKFTGSFNGQGFTISNLYINRTCSDGGAAGLFGATEGAKIINVKMVGTDVTGCSPVGALVGEAVDTIVAKSSSDGIVKGLIEVGGLIGAMYGDGVITTGISSSYTTGEVQGDSLVGGLIGKADWVNFVRDSYSTADINLYDGGSHSFWGFGGLIGVVRGIQTAPNKATTIFRSYATGNIDGGTRVVECGGLIGEIWYGEINQSYATGDVTCPYSMVGGLVGSADGGYTAIIDSYCRGTVTSDDDEVGGLLGWGYLEYVHNSYSTSPIVSSGAYVGGVLGYGYFEDAASNYWDVQVSGQSQAYGYIWDPVYIADGRNTLQMKEQSNFIGWNFDEIWGIDPNINDGYPYHKGLDYWGKDDDDGEIVDTSIFPEEGVSHPDLFDIRVNGAVRDSQDRIYVVGVNDQGWPNSNMLLLRFNSDLTLDTSFNEPNGFINFNYLGNKDEGHDVKLLSDGKIVVTGSVTGSDSCDMAVWRFNSDGSVDTSFGNGDGYIIHNNAAGGESGDRGMSIEVLYDGRYLITGHSYSATSGEDADMVVWKLNEDGSLDPTFGDGSCYNGVGVDGKYGCLVHMTAAGKVEGDTAWEKGFGIAVQSDGKFIAVGKSRNVVTTGTESDFVVWRFNANGTLDETFGDGSCYNGVGVDGKYGCFVQNGAAGGVGCDKGWIVELQSTGKIVIAGQSIDVNSKSNLVVWRLNSNGTLDESFGDGSCSNGVGGGGRYGCSVYHYGGTNGTRSHGMILTPDDKIVMSGQTTPDNWPNNQTLVGLWRFNTNGTLDESFGDGSCNNGTGIESNKGCIIVSSIDVNTNQGWRSKLGDVVMLSNSEYVFVTAGRPFSSTDLYGVALLKYGIPEPPPEMSLSIVPEYVDIKHSFETDLAIGDVDPSFNSAWPGAHGIGAIEEDSQGRLLVGEWRVLGKDHIPTVGVRRLNVDGSLDSSFNIGAGFGPSLAQVRALYSMPNGQILVGGDFDSFNGISRKGLIRLNADGSIDQSYDSKIEATTPTPNQWCSNAGAAEVVVMTIDFDVALGSAGWPACWNWCVNNMNDTHICQFNADGPRHCWIKTAPNGNPANCTWSAGGPPYGGSLNYGPTWTSQVIMGSGVIGDVVAIESAGNGKYYIGGSLMAYSKEFPIDVEDQIWGIARINSDGSQDTTFNPGTNIKWGGFTSSVEAIAVQSGDKIVVGGYFDEYAGVSRKNILRLNSDGSLDTSFNPGSGANAGVRSIHILENGKILIAGNFTSYNGVSRNRIARLNSDGSLDLTFDPGSGTNGDILNIFIEAGGKILISGSFTSYNGVSRNRIARLNTNGSLDLGFNPGEGANSSINDAFFTRRNTLVLGGVAVDSFTEYNTKAINTGLTRVLVGSNSGLEARFRVGETIPSGGTITLTFPYDSNGISGYKFVTGGVEDPLWQIASYPSKSIVEHCASNSCSVTFTLATTALSGSDLVLQLNAESLGSILAPETPGPYLFRLDTSSGDKIAGYQYVGNWGEEPGEPTIPPGTDEIVSLTIEPRRVAGEKFIVGDNVAVIDNSFTTSSGANGSIWSIKEQDDGKVLIGGDFTTYNGIPRYRIARLNADGTLDDSFLPGTGFNSRVNSIDVQADGKIVVGGLFTTYQGVSKSYLIRLNSDGSIDDTFTVVNGIDNEVFAVAVDTDGTILIGGSFKNVGGIGLKGLARLNSNGSVNNTFVSGWGDGLMSPSDASVRTITLLPDGKIIIGGRFILVNWNYRDKVAKLNYNGSVDYTYANANSSSVSNNGMVLTSALLDDGSIVIAGSLTDYNASSVGRFVKLNEEGRRDTNFNIGSGANSTIRAVTAAPNGKVLLVGEFSVFNGTSRNRVVRLNANGSTDTTLNIGTGPNSSILSLDKTKDNSSIYLGGMFSQYQGASRGRIVRVNNSGKEADLSALFTIERILRSGDSVTLTFPYDSTGVNGYKYSTSGGFNWDILGITITEKTGSCVGETCSVTLTLGETVSSGSTLEIKATYKGAQGHMITPGTPKGYIISVESSKGDFAQANQYVDGGVITNLPEVIEAHDVDDGVNIGVVPQVGNRYAGLLREGRVPIIRGRVNLDEDRDWSGVTAAATSNKSLFHYSDPSCDPYCTFEDIPGTLDSSYTLLVPAHRGDVEVLVCPNATNIEDLALGCANGEVFQNGDRKRLTFQTGEDTYRTVVVKVDLETSADGVFWVIDGVLSTGGVSLNGSVGALFNLKDTLSRLEVSEYSNHTIELGTINGLDNPGDKIEITFDPESSAWDLSDITINDITLQYYDGVDYFELNLAEVASDTAWGVSIEEVALGASVDRITFSHPTLAGVESIDPNSGILVSIGTHVLGGINQIKNPTIVQDYEIHIKNTYVSGDGGVETGEITIPIIDDDTVNLHGYLDTLMTFDIDTAVTNTDCDGAGGLLPCSSHGSVLDGAGYVVSLGELNLLNVNRSGGEVLHADGVEGYINYIWFDIETNASGGAVVTVTSANGGLFKDASNIIPSVPLGGSYLIDPGSGLYGINHRAGMFNQTTIGSIAINAYCVGDNTYCGVGDGSGVPVPIFNTNSAPVAGGRVNFSIGATPTGMTASGTYWDQLTFIATSKF